MKKKLTATVTAAALILTVAVSAAGCGKKGYAREPFDRLEQKY